MKQHMGQKDHFTVSKFRFRRLRGTKGNHGFRLIRDEPTRPRSQHALIPLEDLALNSGMAFYDKCGRVGARGLNC
jgi:hypothetical protein